MSKTLCKWPRKEIASSLDELCQVVASPAYVCRSCARSAADKSLLCKPVALPAMDATPAERREQCLPASAESSPVEVVVVEPATLPINKPSIKQAKKALKRQKKTAKKLAKIVKQQKKWAKKQKKIARSFQKLQDQSPVLLEPKTTPIH